MAIYVLGAYRFWLRSDVFITHYVHLPRAVASSTISTDGLDLSEAKPAVMAICAMKVGPEVS